LVKKAKSKAAAIYPLGSRAKLVLFNQSGIPKWF